MAVEGISVEGSCSVFVDTFAVDVTGIEDAAISTPVPEGAAREDVGTVTGTLVFADVVNGGISPSEEPPSVLSGIGRAA